MTWKGWISSLAWLVVVFSGTGCAFFSNPEPGKEYSCVDDEVRAGDTLFISILDIPEPVTEKAFVVRNDGMVNLPLIGSIPAVGKKFAQFERDIQNAYVTNKIYRQVTVQVKPGDRFYSVGGEVKAPGRQLYLGQTTVLRAIVTCGDFNEFANRRRVEIVRANGDREVMDCKAARSNPQKYDRPLCPGDAVFVPRSL